MGGIPLGNSNIIPGVDAKTLHRSHELSGNRSIKKVAEMAEEMRQGTYSAPPIDVVAHNGQYYIIDGHHRAAAARRTDTAVDIKTWSEQELASHTSSYKSIEEVVRDAQFARPDRLINKYRN